MAMTAARPLPLTLLALALWFVSLGGIGAAFTFAEGSAVLVVAFVAYATTALAAGYALWAMKTWASPAFAFWAIIALLNGVLFDLLFAGGPSLRGAAFVLLFGSVLWWVYRYVRSRTSVGV